MAFDCLCLPEYASLDLGCFISPLIMELLATAYSFPYLNLTVSFCEIEFIAIKISITIVLSLSYIKMKRVIA